MIKKSGKFERMVSINFKGIQQQIFNFMDLSIKMMIYLLILIITLHLNVHH